MWHLVGEVFTWIGVAAGSILLLATFAGGIALFCVIVTISLKELVKIRQGY
jgi:hypothetical protein